MIQTIKNHFKKFELQRWYKSKNNVAFMFIGAIDKKKNIDGYGIFMNSWVDDKSKLFFNNKDLWIMMKEEEVHILLEMEARKRGFFNLHLLHFKDVDDYEFRKGSQIQSENKTSYDPETQSLYIDGIELFRKGKWAYIYE